MESDARFENVILGLPPSSDSSSNLEEKIQNNLIDSPPQSSRNLSESRSSSSSSFNKNSKPENNTDSNKHSIEAVTLTGHNVSFGSGKKSGREEDQQPQMIPTLTSRSKEGTEVSDISPIIRDTQIEIALEIRRKNWIVHTMKYTKGKLQNNLQVSVPTLLIKLVQNLLFWMNI